jgi:hypothetical protein
MLVTDSIIAAKLNFIIVTFTQIMVQILKILKILK